MLTIHADQAAPQAWRNGGGRTRELLAWPAGADWTLRVSLADIDADGPFSAFAGVQRWFAVVQGAGVRLQFHDGERRLLPGDAPLCFDGAAAPGCTLVAGPTRDLNLMVRGGTGAMRTVSAGQWWHEALTQRGLFTLVAGRWQAASCGANGANGAEGAEGAERAEGAGSAGSAESAEGLAIDEHVAAHTLLWDLGNAPCRFVPDGAGPCGWWLGWAEQRA